MRERRGRSVFFIDIAVPRDLDPAINDLEGCYLYDIDDLERVVEESIVVRRDEAARAEAIVLEEADAFRAWRRALDVVPAMWGSGAIASAKQVGFTLCAIAIAKAHRARNSQKLG